MRNGFSSDEFDWFCQNRQGNFATLFALSAPLVLLALGAAVDYSHAVSTRQKMQSAIDGAVLLGAKVAETGTQSTAITQATNMFAANVESGVSVTPSFAFSSSGVLTGTASYSMPTMYSSWMGASAMTVMVNAQAQPGAAAASPVCVLLLGPATGQALLANSGANITGNCEIDVKSTANPVAMFNSGSTFNMTKICLQGANYTNNGGTHPNISTNCTTTSNPYVNKLPAPASTACSAGLANGGNYNGGTVSLQPGVYCGGFNFNNAPTVTFASGVYVIKGGSWNVDGGSWTGSGVTFYFADSSELQFNSGMSVTLSAPTTGTYAGILIYEPDGLSSSNFTFDDSVSESLTGLIYLPSRNLTFNSTSNVSSPNISIVANSASFNTVNWTLTPVSSWPISGASSSGGSGASLLVN